MNKSQSTNDAYPCGFRIAVYNSVIKLTESIELLKAGFDRKATEFEDILKMGRTQLQDAVPMTFRPRIPRFLSINERRNQNLKRTAELLLEMNLGATAIGTGFKYCTWLPKISC